MCGSKFNISLLIVLVSLFSSQAFSQQVSSRDSLAEYNYGKVNLKPTLNYTVGSTFIIVPHLGTIAGFTLAPSLSLPLSAKWSLDGGIIAGRYYSALRNVNPEGMLTPTLRVTSRKSTESQTSSLFIVKTLLSEE